MTLVNSISYTQVIHAPYIEHALCISAGTVCISPIIKGMINSAYNSVAINIIIVHKPPILNICFSVMLPFTITIALLGVPTYVYVYRTRKIITASYICIHV